MAGSLNGYGASYLCFVLRELFCTKTGVASVSIGFKLRVGGRMLTKQEPIS
ncbi:hypothetical protein Q31b_46100 [Novipirellula aureliae]|uniref:Uncharacterized protein n=1 Tax=Novipirellula aureliae TaxID=2527966 RepID=A0A5C6DQ96_9BACT|nr:hypothetical protein Q31b_46100 [Novipirellula aureliae]